MFKRYTGFTTAYVGSSNLSNVAISSGLEWNVKVTAQDLPDTVKKINATFETYWNNNDFELYSEEQRARLEKALKAEKYLDGKSDQPYVFDITPYKYQQEILDKLEAIRLVQKSMDKILAYMYLMIKESKSSEKPIKRENFVTLGGNIEFFNGVEEWFDRITEYGKEKGVTIEHYIISSGLKEIIEGSKIYKKFKKIYACEFLYEENGLAVWPKMAVNYTTKTQFLFRINKGVLDISEDEKLNQYVDNDDRPIPFRNMIYIGDGLTDVPWV